MRYDIPSFWHTSLGFSIIIKLTYKVYKLHGLSKTVGDGFSHIIVVSYLDRVRDYVLTVKPRGLLKFGLRLEELPELGVFSTDSPARPNPIGISVVKLKKRVVRELYVEGCDLFNNTPVIDIKPLTTDKIPENVRFPDWYERLLRLAKERSGIDLRKV